MATSDLNEACRAEFAVHLPASISHGTQKTMKTFVLGMLLIGAIAWGAVALLQAEEVTTGLILALIALGTFSAMISDILVPWILYFKFKSPPKRGWYAWAAKTIHIYSRVLLLIFFFVTILIWVADALQRFELINVFVVGFTIALPILGLQSAFWQLSKIAYNVALKAAQKAQ